MKTDYKNWMPKGMVMGVMWVTVAFLILSVILAVLPIPHTAKVIAVCCELDYILTEESHGKLIREYTLAEGGPICDYWIVPDKMENPQ